jgi:hypothetical protein
VLALIVSGSCGGKSIAGGSSAAADSCRAFCAALLAKNCALPVYKTVDECQADECANLASAPAACEGPLKTYYDCEASQADLCADEGCIAQLGAILACQGTGGGGGADGGGSGAGGAGGGGTNDAGTDAGGCRSVADEFSRVGANPSGQWSYGWSSKLDSPFKIFTTFTSKLGDVTDSEGGAYWTDGVSLNPTALLNPTDRVFHTGGTYTLEPGQFALHPGPMGQYAIARWIVSRSARYSIRAGFTGLSGYGGNPVTTTDVHVRHNGMDLSPGFVNVNGSGNSFQYMGTVTAAPGDVIDFAVGHGNGSYAYDSTALDAVICEL